MEFKFYEAQQCFFCENYSDLCCANSRIWSIENAAEWRILYTHINDILFGIFLKSQFAVILSKVICLYRNFEHNLPHITWTNVANFVIMGFLLKVYISISFSLQC